ncbi:carotenoid cleavage dioxygenase 7, chloroplastic isoform X2 [Spinacia oleracea]|uniref:Carotenoid cleavage dioxygenase 7, chloroplastic isoform X2 n=1 Tax=Spinacia oleracea TaxID=3562 RepID=A0ABM3R7G4_SPIOL|nr:carotenoid cleavage dioxygenase 7, chloroplastic isoform X2 [Spinacia oleracea]
MLAKPHHIISPSIFRTPENFVPPQIIRYRPNATTIQPIPISFPDKRVPIQEVNNEKMVAFWDYQFLFMSQRLEVPNPIKLKLIEGSIPKDFPSGTYFLTGPGLFIDDYGSKIHPLDGHGYLRAFEIDGPNGEVRFSAKYVKTKAQMEECDPISGSWKFTHRGPFSVLKGKMIANTKVMKNVANTSILKWGGRLFCLWEGGTPYEINPKTLDTIGSLNFINDDDEVYEARVDQSHAWDVVARILKPILHGIFKMPSRRLLSHYKIDAQRKRLIVMACNAEDMVLPRSHYTFYGSMAAITGQAPMISALSVNHSKTTSSIYILPRFSNTTASNCDTDEYWRKPIEAPQLWLLHVANAFENIDDDGNVTFQIHATACAYKWFNFQKMFGYNWQNDKLDPSMMNCKEGKEQRLPHLVEVTIKLDRTKKLRECTVTRLNKRAKSSDFPVINPECSGYKHRYVYAAASCGSHQTLSHFPFDTLLKLDHLTKKVFTWSPGSRRFVGEPMFVNKGSFGEDDGYLLVVEYVVSRRMCNLVILDSKRIVEARAVIARFEVPKSLTFPLGFHGTWTPKE